MNLSDPVIGLAIFVWGGMILMLLWHVATELKAIHTILADIAAATRVTAERVTETSKYETKETNRLLKLAIKKHWGTAIDLSDER